MRRIIENKILCIAAAMSMMMFSSCIIYDNPPPGPGFDSGYDHNLTGYWELAYVNNHHVYGNEVNWLDFYGDGYGVYYYNSGPYTYKMPFDYYCEYDYDNWLYIYYSDGTYAEMVYWFSYDFSELYLEWYERGQRVVYTYYWVDDYYWDTPPMEFKPTRSETSLINDLRPGYVAKTDDDE